MLIYAVASIYGSFMALVQHLRFTAATFVFVILASGAIFGHWFIGYVIDEQGECP